jgi:hypothetical protein
MNALLVICDLDECEVVKTPIEVGNSRKVVFWNYGVKRPKRRIRRYGAEVRPIEV